MENKCPICGKEMPIDQLVRSDIRYCSLECEMARRNETCCNYREEKKRRDMNEIPKNQ